MKVISCALCLFAILLPPGYLHAQPEKSNILIIHSYHQGMAWTDNIMEGIGEIFEYDDIRTNIHVEYMDTKRYSPDDMFPLVYELLTRKYKNTKMDLVLVSDDNAYNFMLEFGDRLFPQVPVVFCGINYFDQTSLADRDNHTGVVENVAISETLETALKLHPETEQVFVVNDHTTTGRALKRIVQSAIPRFGSDLTFHFLDSLTLAELKERLEALPPRSVILLLSFNRDSSGQTFSYRESIKQIAPHASAPMYGVWEFYLGDGIVGGKLTRGRAQGKAAALMGRRILQGTPADRIPVRLENGSTYMFDYRLLKKYGIRLKELPAGSVVVNEPDTFFYEHRVLILSALGAIAALFLFSAALVVNIIQRKKTEQKILENARLKSEFVTTAAHEFRTPLTAIQGYAQLLLMQRDLSSREKEEFLTYIHERSKALAKVVADLLDIGRFESGQKIPMDFTSISVCDLIGRIKPLLAEKEDRHQWEISVENDQVEIRADRDKMIQVFENLLSNAMKYSSAGTQIRIHGSIGEDEENYVFSIADQGMGMTPEQLKRVFDKFYRADASHGAMPGLGLGMSVVRQIIEAHGGEISVASTVDVGTTVNFTVPLSHAAGEPGA